MLCVVNPEMVEVVYQKLSDADPVQVNINVFIAAFMTLRCRIADYQNIMIAYH